MPRSSSKSKSKSLPPLPIVAAHIGAGSSASAANPPAHASSSNNPAESENQNAESNTRRRTCAVTNGCIRTTVTLLVFGAYLVWTWPWHREHGFEDIPWVGGARRSSSSQVQASRVGMGMGIGTGMGMGMGMGMGGMRVEPEPEPEVGVEMEAEGILRAPELGVPDEIQTKWGQYAPYRAMGRYVGPPEGCRVTQVSGDCSGLSLEQVWCGDRTIEATRLRVSQAMPAEIHEVGSSEGKTLSVRSRHAFHVVHHAHAFPVLTCFVRLATQVNIVSRLCSDPSNIGYLLLTVRLQLQRHGARYPNLKEGEQYAAAVARLRSAKKFMDKRLDFLKHYQYDLDADNLTPFGAAQCVALDPDFT